MAYQTEPAYTHGTPEKTAVLLINLGTPDAPTPAAVRRYLKEFLSDPRVVEIPRLAWWPILNGIILNTRPKQSAAKYQSIWMPEGSPHKVHTERLTGALRDLLSARAPGVPLVVEYAMRYGTPAIPDVLRRLKEQNCQRILLVPLYPQYAASTVATALDVVFDTVRRTRNTPALRAIKHFPGDPGYIRSTAQNIRVYWAQHGRPDKLVMSFHGLPRATLDKGDPYHCECLKSARLIAEELGLEKDQYLITFQSRFGRAEWLKPYTAATLKELGRQGTGRVDMVCPGFVTDCLETLEEINIEVRDTFVQAGGGEYHYIPCLNDRPDWAEALADLVMTNLHGWLEKPDAAALEQGRLRALELGAKK
ncbi:MAG TPA: ferrochelatase [Gallionellaceae bacterium]|nr:ferrochelatase [Gallionellaceae bacterium]